MNSYEATSIIARQIPEADNDLILLSITGNLNKAIAILSKYTRSLIVHGEYQLVGKCMAMANDLYIRGDNGVKNAVANIFVYSFSLMSLSCNKEQWHFIQAKIPYGLHSIYIKQMTSISC